MKKITAELMLLLADESTAADSLPPIYAGVVADLVSLGPYMPNEVQVRKLRRAVQSIEDLCAACERKMDNDRPG